MASKASLSTTLIAIGAAAAGLLTGCAQLALAGGAAREQAASIAAGQATPLISRGGASIGFNAISQFVISG